MTGFRYTDRKIVSVEVGPPDPGALLGSARAAFEYWFGLKRDGLLVNIQDFHLDDLPLGVIPWTILYEVVDGGADMRYRFFGTRRVLAHGEDYTNRHVSDMRPEDIGTKIKRELDRIIAERKPEMIKTTASVDEYIFDYTMLRMPLSRDGRTVSHIVAITFNGTGPELPDNLVRKWVAGDDD